MRRITSVIAATGVALMCSGIAKAGSIASPVIVGAVSPDNSERVQLVRHGGHAFRGGGHFRGGAVRFHGGPRFYGGYYAYPYYYDYGPRCWWSRRYHRWVCPYY